MRVLLGAARAPTPHWLAVSVPRDANADEDRLCHLAQLTQGLEEAARAGLQQRVVEIPQRCWAALREAAQAGDAGEGAAGSAKRRRRR
eukprot:4260104-Pleurochrysis_carterae.AAC.1